MERGRRGKRSVCSDFNDTERHGSEFWLMVLRLHTPVEFQRRQTPLASSPSIPLSPHSSLRPFSLSLLFPICAGIFSSFFFFFSIHLDLSATAPLFRWRSSLSFPFLLRVSFVSLLSVTADYITGCNVKYETLHLTVSLETKGFARDACFRTSVPQNRRNTSDYAEYLYMQICIGESCIRRII